MTRKEKIAELDTGYNISVTGRHVSVTDAMKNYAIEKISKLERFAPKIIDVDVIMDIQKLNHKVDIIMKYGHTIIKSASATTDMYVSVDQAVKKLDAQLKKYKSKLHDHYMRGYPVEEVTEVVWGEEEEVEPEEELQEEGFVPHKVVKTEVQPLKLLTDGEAIMRMELSLLPLILYRDEATRKLKVIYKREDGNFGIIQTEQ